MRISRDKAGSLFVKKNSMLMESMVRGKVGYPLLVLSNLIFSIFLFSTDLHAQCSRIGDNGSDQSTNGSCAPITLDMSVNFEFDLPVDPSLVQIHFSWGDGTPDTVVSPDFDSNNRLFYDTVRHYYPPTGPECSYTAEAYVIYDGDHCLSSTQTQQFRSWNIDNENGGHVAINPERAIVCEGDPVYQVFADASTFNCNISVEPDKPNLEPRWVQFIYGTQSRAGDRIPNITIEDENGVTHQMTDAAGNSLGLVYGPIIKIPYEAHGPNQLSYPIMAPPDGVAGDIFEITMRNWNICNPYDDPYDGLPPSDTVNGDNAPIVTTAIVEIISTPPQIPTPYNEYCAHENISLYAHANTATIRWYKDSTLDTLLHTGEYFDPTKPPLRLDNTVGGEYSFWVTAIENACESAPFKIDLKIYDNPAFPDAGPDRAVCLDEVILTAAPISVGSGQWTTASSAIINDPSNDTTLVTNLSTGDQEFTWTVTNGPCILSDEVVISRDLPSVAANAGTDQSLCGTDYIDLNANTPTNNGYGEWKRIIGSANIIDDSDPNSRIEDLISGNNIYTWSVHSEHDACPVTSDTVNVLFDPLPGLADAGPDQAFCDTTRVPLSANAPINGGLGWWQVLDGGGNFNDSTQHNAIIDQLIFDSTLLSWTVQSAHGICPLTTDSVIISIDEMPNPANAGVDQDFCLVTQVQLNADSADIGNGYWSVLQNPSGTVPVFTPSVNAHDAIISINAGDEGLYKLAWTVENGSCITNDEVEIDFGIPPPPAFAGPDDTVCGTAAQLQGVDFSVGSGTWTVIEGAGNVTFSPSIHDAEPWVLLETGRSGKYTFVWELSSGDCAVTRDTVSILFNPLPANPQTQLLTSCGPTDFEIISTPGINANTINWYDVSIGGNLIHQGDTFNTGALSANTSYWISSYNSLTGCESNRSEVIIEINTIPDSPVSQNIENCSPGLFNLVASIGSNGHINHWYDKETGGTLLSTSKNFLTNISASETFWVASYDTITGCEGSRDSVFVEIHPIPDSPVLTDEEACGPSAFTLTSVIGNHGTANYWYESDTSSAPIYVGDDYITPILNSTTTYSVVSVNENTGCRSNMEHVKAIIHPIPAQPAIDDIVVCGPNAFDLATTPGPNATTLRWYENPVDGSPLAQTDTFYTPLLSSSTTYYLAAYNDSTTCESTRDEVNITINPIPDAGIITGVQNIIVGQTDVVYYVIGNPGSSYAWDIPAEIDVIENNGYWIKLGFPNLGSFNISVVETSVNGCPGPEMNKQINVTDGEFTLNLDIGDRTACTADPFHIQPTVIGGKGPYQVEWTGDTAELTATDQLETYLIPKDVGEYMLRLKVTDMNYKTAVDSIYIRVYPSPTAMILAPDTIVCVGESMPLDVQTIDPALEHTWSGQTIALSATDITNPVFLPTANESYSMVYQVTDMNNCIASDSITIHTEQTRALFTTDAVPACSPVSANFINQSTNYDSLIWDFDDGTLTTGEELVHTFNNIGTSVQNYNVTLTSISENGCVDKADAFVTVFPKPYTEIIADPDSACDPAVVSLSASPGNAGYRWDFGDGEVYQGGYNVVHTFRNEGFSDTTYSINLITTSSFECSDTIQHKIVVFSSPKANFTVTPEEQMFPDATVDIVNQTEGNWNYMWYFGDGTQLQLAQPIKHEYEFPNNFSISMVASDEHCKDSLVKHILIKPHPPEAKFEPVDPGCMPLTVTMVNTSSYAKEYYWEFGDGSISNKPNPSYTYYEPGVYKIKLKVKGDGGEDTHSDTTRVFVLPNSFFDLAPRYVYVNDEPVNYFNLSDHGEIFEWDFGDGTTSSQFNPEHIYMEEGTYDVTLKVWTENDCFDLYVMENAVVVEPSGEVAFPNVFRPNSPIEENRYFSPGVIDNVEEYHLMIFNRWGELLFESFDPDEPWDGRYQGRIAKQDVYVWKVKGTFSNGKPFVKTGDVTLLH